MLVLLNFFTYFYFYNIYQINIAFDLKNKNNKKINGEGCFQITLIKTTSNQLGYWVQLSFQLTQHTRDIELINNLKEYLDCGQTTVYDNHNYIRYTVSNISDIMEKVLPFLSPKAQKNI